MTKRKVWLGATAGILAGLVMGSLWYASKSAASVTLRPLKPLPEGSATNITFGLSGSGWFWMDRRSNLVEAITTKGRTNYEFLGGTDIRSLSEQEGNRGTISVALPEGTEEFRLKKGIWRTTALAKLRSSFFEMISGRQGLGWVVGQVSWMTRGLEKNKYSEVWSAWLVKTNGMWVERVEK